MGFEFPLDNALIGQKKTYFCSKYWKNGQKYQFFTWKNGQILNYDS